MTDDELRQLFEKQNAELRGYIDASNAVLRLHFDTRMDAFDTRMDAFDTRMDAFDTRMNAFDTRMDAFGARMDVFDTRMHASTGEMLGHFAELRLHFDAVTERIEDKIGLLAEGLAHLDQKLDRTAADIRRETRDGFDDTHALIRFTYSELDRRLRALE